MPSPLSRGVRGCSRASPRRARARRLGSALSGFAGAGVRSRPRRHRHGLRLRRRLLGFGFLGLACPGGVGLSLACPGVPAWAAWAPWSPSPASRSSGSARGVARRGRLRGRGRGRRRARTVPARTPASRPLASRGAFTRLPRAGGDPGSAAGCGSLVAIAGTTTGGGFGSRVGFGFVVASAAAGAGAGRASRISTASVAPPPPTIATQASSLAAVPTPSSSPSNAAAAPTGSGGTSAFSARGRCSRSALKRLQSGHERRCARRPRPRSTRPSPSESIRRTSWHPISRPSRQLKSALRASKMACLTAPGESSSTTPISAWLRPLSSRRTSAARWRSGRSARSSCSSRSSSRSAIVSSNGRSSAMSESSSVDLRRRRIEIASLWAIRNSHGRSSKSRRSSCSAANARVNVFCSASCASSSWRRIERQ